MGALQIQKVNWWHERLAEWMLKNPTRNLKDAAGDFNCAVGTVYLIHNSDAFKEYWAKVSGGVTSGVSDHIVEKARTVAELALDQLIDKLQIPGSVSAADATDTANKMLHRLGFGATPAGLPAPSVTVNVVQATPDALQAARAKVQALTARPIKNLTAADTEAAESPGEGRAENVS